MHKLLFIINICLIALVVSCGQKNEDKKISSELVTDGSLDPATAPKMAFAEVEHDFGKVTEGEVLIYSFKFKNTGKSDLVITAATASCGCTIPSYPKTPVKPGENAVVEVRFDTHGKQGFQRKTVTVLSNTVPNKSMLNITASVHPAEEN